jgi:hypothetical protein
VQVETPLPTAEAQADQPETVTTTVASPSGAAVATQESQADQSEAAAPLTPGEDSQSTPVPALSAEPVPTAVLEMPVAATPTQAAPRPALQLLPWQGSAPAWPNSQESTAWLAADGYHLFARRSQQFVAVEVLPGPLRDVTVAATFHKSGGPSGGGYGIIVRDQGPGPRDGLNQGGRYYVLEVGDRGEVGIWRREQDQWVDLLAWSPSSAVHPAGAENQLLVSAQGEQLTLSVNGTQVASATDAALESGSVGVFVGGDQNEAVLTHLMVMPAD